MAELVFLKLGGSLITDKSQPYTARTEKLEELSGEIAAALKDPALELQLVLGHGSGSFGHTAAQAYGTREGVHDARGWQGFAEVHYQAEALNRLLMEALRTASVPALPFPPSASAIARDGEIVGWDLAPLRKALASGLLPAVYGDVAFDEVRGATILSTEDLFQHLARELHPRRILLAGLEAGVWKDFPARTQLVEEINPDSYDGLGSGVGAAIGADVTGGMRSKVGQMIKLVQAVPGVEVTIFSAQRPGDLGRALQGEPLGTKIRL